MFIQVIQGMCSDEATMRGHMDRWRGDLSPARRAGSAAPTA